MAKKVRRVKKKKPVQAGNVDKAEVELENAEAFVDIVSSRRQTSAEEFHSEYAYVVKDLRRVLILTAAMFLLLIALNLLLQ